MPALIPSSNHLSLLTTLTLVVLLLLGTLIRFWLLTRQIRHVVQHRASVPVAFANAVSLPAHQKAADYTVAKCRLELIQTALSACLVLGWTLLGGLDLLNRALLTQWSGLTQQVLLVLAFMVISSVLDLPMSLYQTFGIEQGFGFNRMTWRLWLADLARSTLVGTVIGVPLLVALLWLMGAAGTGWWLWAWGLWTGFSLLMLLIYPTWIAPLFNQFKPLEDAALRERVFALMQRCGFSARGLFVMDGSRRSAHGNAYFTGFGATKRVVLFDTLLARLQPDEVDAVLAHELGHFHHRHVFKRMLGLFGISLLGFAALGVLSREPAFYTGLGVLPNFMLTPHLPTNTPNDALALLLFMQVVPLVTYFLSPLMARLSRRDEFQADAYAAAQTDAGSLSSALLKLYEDNASTLTPDPLFAQFYYAHPPASERLARLRLST